MAGLYIPFRIPDPPCRPRFSRVPRVQDSAAGFVFYAVDVPLQSESREQAAWILETSGIPVLLDGNIIHSTEASSVKGSLQRIR